MKRPWWARPDIRHGLALLRALRRRRKREPPPDTVRWWLECYNATLFDNIERRVQAMKNDGFSKAAVIESLRACSPSGITQYERRCAMAWFDAVAPKTGGSDDPDVA
jgi:tRNA A37 N6-isopentenylltransferase MiaA